MYVRVMMTIVAHGNSGLQLKFEIKKQIKAQSKQYVTNKTSKKLSNSNINNTGIYLLHNPLSGSESWLNNLFEPHCNTLPNQSILIMLICIIIYLNHNT